jgi:aminopeptidase N
MKLTCTFFVIAFCLLSARMFSYTPPSDSSKVNPTKKIYRGSATKTNEILHTRLDVRFDWNKSQMNGKASIIGKPHFNPISKLYLDARGMEIQSVEVYDLSSGKTQKTNMPVTHSEIIENKKLSSSYKYENDSIKINLGRQFKSNEKYLVRVNYVAKPDELKKGGSNAISDDKGLFFINPKGEDKNKMPQIWTQGETQANSAWFPTIDSPNEKMTSEIFMTVDEKYTTLSNGLLTDTKKNADGTKTDHWKMDLPHSPYLVMMAVGEFKKVTDAPWNGKEISYYVEKEYEPYAKAIFGNTKEMIEFYSRILETPYPWQKYAQIVVRDYVSGAMENTSATLHGDFMVYQTDREIIDGKKGEDVISHELFHQWFGDLVTAESWSNLPLNESFATYGEYLWQEYKNGRDAADAHSYQSRMGYFTASAQKQVDLIRYDYNDKEDMFDAWSYNKGGQVLHMLRKYVGHKVFFASLKLYLERNRFKNAEIHDLRLAFEEVSGEDLNWFFNEWFLAKGHPELEIQKNYNAEEKTLVLKIRQKQNLDKAPLYTLPVDIDIYADGKKERHRIVIDQVEQEFLFPVAVSPDLVNFDAEKQLLAIKTYSKSVEELIFQYRNAPLFSDRLEALTVLKSKTDQEEVYKMFVYAAENDNWFEHRSAAIEALKELALGKETELKPLLIKIALTDKNTNVKAKAVSFLGSKYKGVELDNLYKKCLDEKSYAIDAAALNALSKSDSVFAMQKAKELESEKNQQIFGAIASIYTRFGTDENNSYFIKNKDNFSGRAYVNYIFTYGSFLDKCKDPKTFESAAAIFIDITKKSNGDLDRFINSAYKKFILDILKTREEDLKIANASPEKIKEIENTRIKLENLLKGI